MKKILLIPLLLISFLSFADFLSDVQKIDEVMQSKDYEKAYQMAQDLSNTDLSDENKQVLETIIEEIKNNLPKEVDSTLPEYTRKDRSMFREYNDYEKQILSTNNPDAINEYCMLYIKEGLYERAMNFALKDKTRSLPNIYLAATTARLLGYYDKSLSLYNEVLKKNPEHAKSILGMAMAYKGRGDFAAALRYMKEYSKYTNDSSIQEAIDNLELALKSK